MISDPYRYLLLVVGFYQRSVPLFLYGFQCYFYLKDLPIGNTISCCRFMWVEHSMDYRHYSIKNIFMAHGDEDTEVEFEIIWETGVRGLQ